MAIEEIFLGNYPNDGTGDDLRTAFTKVNANFALLDAEANINNGENVGSGTGIFKQAVSASLQFKSLTSTDTSVLITSTTDSINLAANTRLSADPAPELGANLNLNGRVISGSGDVQATVYSFSVPTLQYLVALLLESNSLAMDMGTFGSPTGFETSGVKGYPLDMNGTLTDGGGFTATPPVNQINFGEFDTGSSIGIPSIIDGGGSV